MSAAENPASMTYAQAACLALQEAMRADPNVVALGEDLGRGGIFGQYRGLPQEAPPPGALLGALIRSRLWGAAFHGMNTAKRDLAGSIREPTTNIHTLSRLPPLTLPSLPCEGERGSSRRLS